MLMEGDEGKLPRVVRPDRFAWGKGDLEVTPPTKQYEEDRGK